MSIGQDGTRTHSYRRVDNRATTVYRRPMEILNVRILHLCMTVTLLCLCSLVVAANSEDQPTIPELQNHLSAAQNRIASLESAYQEQLRIQQMYEEALSEATERIRNYCFEQQNHVIALHQHYTTLLASSRNETLQAQLTHQQWQSSLQKVSEGVRMALKERTEETVPYRRRVAALKEENRVLRAKVGWDPPEDSEDEESSVGDEGVGMEEKRGRTGVPQGAADSAADGVGH